MRILVTGATGGTGQAIVREALARGHEVTALVRSKDTAASLLPGATLVEGDARDTNALFQALDNRDAVLSALGSRKIRLFGRVTLMSEATHALVSAMERQRVLRLVCITGLGAGDSAGHGGFVYDRLLKPILLRTIYQDKDRQEAVVRKSSLDWVLVRPTVLTDGPATGAIRAITDLRGFRGGRISRADVATFVVNQAQDDRWLWKTPLITHATYQKG